MYDSLKWNRRGLTDLMPEPYSPTKELWVAIPHFPGYSKICCHAVRPQRALGSCFPKAPSQNAIKRFAQPETKVKGDWKEKDMKTERRAVKGRGCGEASKRKKRVWGGQKDRERRGCCVSTNLASHCFSMHFTRAQSSSIDQFIVFN